ncbi:MAG: HAMP domain-containing histidine kinase [Nocardioidaceae bacterium]|nr:HAMP domain-containing histidine kinase [Nocardioidaceae bacterium]
MSMAARISLLAACAVGLAVALSSVAAYVTLRAQLHDRLDSSLLQRASQASRTDFVSKATLLNIPSDFLGAADLRIFLISSGEVIPADRADWISPLSANERAVADGSITQNLRTIYRDGHEYRVATVQAQSGTALMFVQSAEPIERTLDRLGFVLLLVGAGGIVAAALIGLAVGRSALMPVRRLSAAAEHIARTEQLKPIQVTGDDELASLATSFNKMLVALQASRDRQRRLVADAGHELRTPLTSLRTNLELLAQADRRGGLAPHQRDELLTDVTGQVEELSTLVGDLVELARDEPLERTPEPLDLADIVARATDRVRRRAPGVTFDVHTNAWWVVGEAQILERAVTNLLDNAAKYGPPGGTVTVELDKGQLDVADQGEGITDRDLPMIFERFYRADSARTMPGSGLGLSIVRQAAERHGGSVSVRNSKPHGVVFSMRVPGRGEDRAAPVQDARAAVLAQRPPASR